MTRVFQTSTRRNVVFSIFADDIGAVVADAMITAINSGGLWMGGIDRVIERYAGNQFHAQAAAQKLSHLTTVVARKERPHRAKFENVVFVVDDLKSPVRDVVYAGLKAASDAGFACVSLPAIRTGVMLGVVEKDAQEAVNGLMKGILDFFTDFPNTVINDVKFVIYSDGEIMNMLNAAQQKLLV